MPGVTVKLLRGADTQSTATRFDGSFSFEKVTPGTYDIQVEREGFKPFTSHVVVGARSPRATRIKLAIANLKQEITVEGDDDRVSADAGNNRDSTTLEGGALNDVPVFDNNYIATISRFLDPRAAGTGGTTLIMDGVQVGSVALPASAIQEVRINQNPYSPEYLRPGRARIEVVTKPGASAYHGSVNSIFRDNRLNARE